jgi:hypothetical protein
VTTRKKISRVNAKSALEDELILGAFLFFFAIGQFLFGDESFYCKEYYENNGCCKEEVD